MRWPQVSLEPILSIQNLLCEEPETLQTSFSLAHQRMQNQLTRVDGEWHNVDCKGFCSLWATHYTRHGIIMLGSPENPPSSDKNRRFATSKEVRVQNPTSWVTGNSTVSFSFVVFSPKCLFHRTRQSIYKCSAAYVHPTGYTGLGPIHKKYCLCNDRHQSPYMVVFCSTHGHYKDFRNPCLFEDNKVQ